MLPESISNKLINICIAFIDVTSDQYKQENIHQHPIEIVTHIFYQNFKLKLRFQLRILCETTTKFMDQPY